MFSCFCREPGGVHLSLMMLGIEIGSVIAALQVPDMDI